MNIVYAKADVSGTVGGAPFHLNIGEAWNGDDPVVKAHPDLFDVSPPFVRTSKGMERVERATAGPGEKRKSGR